MSVIVVMLYEHVIKFPFSNASEGEMKNDCSTFHNRHAFPMIFTLRMDTREIYGNFKVHILIPGALAEGVRRFLTS